MDHFPSTESAVTALRLLAAEYGREIEVTHDIGADRTSRRTSAGVGCVRCDPSSPITALPTVEWPASTPTLA